MAFKAVKSITKRNWKTMMAVKWRQKQVVAKNIQSKLAKQMLQSLILLDLATAEELK